MAINEYFAKSYYGNDKIIFISASQNNLRTKKDLLITGTLKNTVFLIPNPAQYINFTA
jgi:hypothetical protein